MNENNNRTCGNLKSKEKTHLQAQIRVKNWATGERDRKLSTIEEQMVHVQKALTRNNELEQ